MRKKKQILWHSDQALPRPWHGCVPLEFTSAWVRKASHKGENIGKRKVGVSLYDSA